MTTPLSPNPNLNNPKRPALDSEPSIDGRHKEMLSRASTLLSRRGAAAVAALGSRGRGRVQLPAMAPTAATAR